MTKPLSLKNPAQPYLLMAGAVFFLFFAILWHRFLPGTFSSATAYWLIGFVLFIGYLGIFVLCLRPRMAKPLALFLLPLTAFALYQLLYIPAFGFSFDLLIRALQGLASAAAVFLGWTAARSFSNGNHSSIATFYWSLFLGLALTALAALMLHPFEILSGNSPGYFLLFALPLLFLFANTRIQNKAALILLLVFAITAILYTSRGGLLASLIFVISFTLINTYPRKAIYQSLLVFVTFGITTIILIGSGLWLTDLIPTLEQFSREYFDRRFFTGRDTLWTQLAGLISDQWFLGYGPQAQLSHFIATGLSAHNLFLQVLLQNGVTGFLLLSATLYSFAIFFIRTRFFFESQIGFSFLLAVLVHQTFSVTLTQTTFAYGIPMWLILGLCAGLAWHRSNESKTL